MSLKFHSSHYVIFSAPSDILKVVFWNSFNPLYVDYVSYNDRMVKYQFHFEVMGTLNNKWEKKVT